MANLALLWGCNLKSVSDQGILEGKAVVFGSEDSPDISSFKDFFTSDTYVHPDESFTTPLFFEHGMSYPNPIGKALVYKTSTGWNATAQLDLENPFVKSRFSEIKAGGWGYSSGSVGHVVHRDKKANGTHHITQWPIGELSVTQRPAEPKALIHSVKSLEQYYGSDMGQMPMPNSNDNTDSDSNSNDNIIQILMDIIEQLLEQISQKQIKEFLIPEINAVKSELAEIKESLLLPKGNTNDEELTVLKSENEELTSKLSELQSSFEEKEALLSEKMALLSETQAELEAKSQEIEPLEEALSNSQAEVASLNEKVKTLKKATSALAKTNFNI